MDFCFDHKTIIDQFLFEFIIFNSNRKYFIFFIFYLLYSFLIQIKMIKLIKKKGLKSVVKRAIGREMGTSEATACIPLTPFTPFTPFTPPGPFTPQRGGVKGRCPRNRVHLYTPELPPSLTGPLSYTPFYTL
jgi:hypothetical protein